MKNYDESVEINQNSNWIYNPYRILIVGGSGSGKTNVLLSLIKNQRPDIEKIYLYVIDPFELRYQLLINRKEEVGNKKSKDPKAFIYYSKTNDDVFENLEDYNQTKKRKVSLMFDDMIAHMEANRKLSHIVPKFFLRGRKLNISLVLISRSYFKVAKTIRLDATHFFIIKILSRKRTSTNSIESFV